MVLLENEETEEEIVEEPIAEEVEETSKEVEESKKYDPFAAYRNRVNKGHGSKKVPSFKSLHPQEEKTPVVKTPAAKTPVETKPAAPIKKANPFDAYKNQPKKAGSGSKKVTPMKKEEPKVSKNDPFAAYRNRIKEKNTSTKK